LDTRYKKIAEYGVIGNRCSAALVGIDGSIDWCCLPYFDSPSVFAAILDADKGGKFQICPAGRYSSEQSYEEKTNILTTLFKTPSGTVSLIDFMPCFMRNGEFKSFSEIHRHIDLVDGNDIEFVLKFDPRFDYAVGKTNIKSTKYGLIAHRKNKTLSLIYQNESEINFRPRDQTGIQKAIRNFKLSEKNDRKIFVMKYGQTRTSNIAKHGSDNKLAMTRDYWRYWTSNIKYKGRWRDQVIRSALVLKLLQYAPTGALIAAVTTSLPEKIGGDKNWDYRFSWIRDTGFSLWSLDLIGCYQESFEYFQWLLNSIKRRKNLPVLLPISGKGKVSESELSHLEGYEGSRPVRIGNKAYDQLQLDVYGILIDAVYFLFKYLGVINKETYETLVRDYANVIEKSWKSPDHGIWEIREGSRRRYVESRWWCYVGLDRALKLASYLGYFDDARRWQLLRDRIKAEVIQKGWSKKEKAFMMYYGKDSVLDAANLLMPLVKFLPFDHPKVVSTMEKIRKELTQDKLVFRYSSYAFNDTHAKTSQGTPDRKINKFPEGSFVICTFWLVECLIGLGKIKQAEKLFIKLLNLSNHLGLYSEEIDPRSHELLGNFPQSYAHMGFISAAVHLDKALSERDRKRHLTATNYKGSGSGS
jgi:GH15 family glucan-1,4-alpha-glucosidase